MSFIYSLFYLESESLVAAPLGRIITTPEGTEAQHFRYVSSKKELKLIANC